MKNKFISLAFNGILTILLIVINYKLEIDWVGHICILGYIFINFIRGIWVAGEYE